MSKSIPEMLTASAEEVLETMFFTQVIGRGQEAGSSDVEAEKKPYIAVRLCFLGGAEPGGNPSTDRPGGHFDIEVSRAGAQWIASSFLAADDGSVPQHRVADVICELTNVVCGNILSNIASHSGFSRFGFSMLSPEVIRGRSLEWPHAVRYEEFFQLERGWLTLRLGLANA